MFYLLLLVQQQFWGKSIMLIKTYKAYFFKRNIFTMEKEAYNDKEYCEDCYFSLIKKIGEFICQS